MSARLHQARLRIIFALVLLLSGPFAVAGVPPTAAPQARAAAPRPNVVLIVTDDHRWDQINKMPVLQAELVSKGTYFRNAFVTNSLCCPSRATYLTGKHSHTHGVYTNGGKNGGFSRFKDSSTLATWLQAAGYRTALVGKYFNLYNSATYIPPGWDVWNAFVGTTAYYNYTLTQNGVTKTYGSTAADYSTDVLAGLADTFIRSVPSATPLFLYYAPYAPHTPPIPAPRHANSFSDFVGIRPPNLNEADVSDKPGWVRSLSVAGGTHDGTRKKQYQSLLAVDAAIDVMLDALRDSGRLSDTLFVFASDNGFSGRSHRWVGKEAPYEESIRIPLVIRYDAMTGGVARVDDHLALNLDVAQTLAEVAGVAAPGAEGRSLVPLVRGDPTPWRSRFLVEHLQTSARATIPTYCAVRTEQYKYVKYQTGEEELYDLVADPYELKSQHGNSALAAVKAALHADLVELCSPPPPNYVP